MHFEGGEATIKAPCSLSRTTTHIFLAAVVTCMLAHAIAILSYINMAIMQKEGPLYVGIRIAKSAL